MALVPLGALSTAHGRRAAAATAASTRASVQPGHVGRSAVPAPIAEAAHGTWLSVCSPLTPCVVATVAVAAVTAVIPSLAPCTATPRPTPRVFTGSSHTLWVWVNVPACGLRHVAVWRTQAARGRHCTLEP